MADCNKLLMSYSNYIKLKDSRRTKLEKAKIVIENKIKNSEEYEASDYNIDFRPQGSFEMDTIINPIDSDDSYDIDHGVYFVSDNEPKVVSTTIKKWIFDVLENHTNNVTNKKNCIRVQYSVSDDLPAYHIDIPVYWQKSNETPLLASTKGWLESDPVQFLNWFKNLNLKSKNQLKRVTRYLKWWSKNHYNMPTGIILTILAAYNYHSDERDDLSFYQTLNSIYVSLSNEFSCFRPTVPTDEDLFSEYGETNKEFLLNKLNGFLKKALKALETESQEEAAKIWLSIFGDKLKSLTVEYIEAINVSESMKSGILKVDSSGLLSTNTEGTHVKPTKFYGDY